MEDFARIIDYLPLGHPDRARHRREPVAFGLGEDEFKLFELIPKPDVALNVGDRVYIGKDLESRDKIQHVKRRIGREELTVAAQSELPYAIHEIVVDNEERFVRFYNEAQAITTRFHMLELLPGLGKKTMWAILEERKQGPFKNLAELTKRVPTLHHPEKLIVKRIEVELADASQKYHIFVAR